ncbi:hypothetical protein E1B28_011001 [Marasmius oreades]|uniref:Uncharacterized protein n=1 Tax=Marasmius oreades TaxID=181124 RepID=A0A9P7RTT9_9AGAR|nr:uncharacterized protein E1B28_011001 [Marasmius oreades]KAG7089303.1 hypothetical protein E1B28_011001 [Marasmius oreades]
MTFFTELEDIIYAPVEYIPVVGTVFSFKRAHIAYSEADWKRHWQSVSNFGWGLVRDAVLISGTAEAAPVIVIHAMAEALTDKLVEVYAAKSAEEAKIPMKKRISTANYHLLVTGETKEKSEATAKQLFRDGHPKGLRYFHRSHFVGRFTHPKFAARGENISLHLPNGFYPGATCIFSWKWTKDAAGVKNRPEHTKGTLKIDPGNDSGTSTRFDLATNENHYNFWGDILSEDKLWVKTRIDGDPVSFEMKRVKARRSDGSLLPSRVMHDGEVNSSTDWYVPGA